ncbi:MAG: hypothetical protein MUC68_12750 [Burkholderiaceae bacterium]|nr:hypothetical protein [Burkholderiaceae bacterium]
MKPRLRSYDPLDVRMPHRPAAAASVSSAMGDGQLNGLSKLERRYPHIAKALTLLWGYPEMNDYFAKLWLSDSDPIDPEAMADLMLLARVHRELSPSRATTQPQSIYGTAYGDTPSRRDVWGDATLRR